jgi:hypothetical protein
MILCTIGSGVNMLFSLRAPSVTITTYVIQLIAYPIGLGWDLVMPDKEFKVLGLKFNLRPGRFNFKEHVVIVVMSNVSTRRAIPFPHSTNENVGCIRRRRLVCDRCTASSAIVLRTKLWLGLSAPFRHHDTLHRVWPGGIGEALPCLASRHDLAV